MKYEPISSHEKPTIIQHLAKQPSWQGRRKGVFVRIVRLKVPGGSTVAYSVDLQPTPRSGDCSTVSEAIDQINAAIMARPERHL